MKRYKNYAFMMLTLFIAMCISGCGKTDSVFQSVNIKTATADEQKLDTTLDITGVLVPFQTVNIQTKLNSVPKSNSEVVNSVNVDVGSNVKKGDILITLDTNDLNIQLKQAEAALKSVQDQAAQAKISLDMDEKTLYRTKQLFDSHAVSQSQLDAIQSEYDLDKVKYETYTGSAQEQAQATIDSLKLQIGNAIITSPINGTVVNKNVNPGEIVSSGMTLLSIADASILKLKSTVPQEVVPWLKVGHNINVFINIYPDKVFGGQITMVGPITVSTGEYFPIEISLKNPNGIKPGVTANASIRIYADEGIVVPASAVVQENGQCYTFVVQKGIAHKRIITIGLKNDTRTMVLKGLDKGEKVAVTNANDLIDNMTVHVSSSKQ